MLDSLPILDMRAQVAARPRHPRATRQPRRVATSSVTFHFSDAFYRDRSRAAELRRILSEADYQLKKNWAKIGRPPIYGDQYQYEYVVLSDGQIVWVSDSMQFWHCRNVIGNGKSCPVHVMLGRGQDLTAPQRASVFALFDALCAEYRLVRTQVVAHCEWPIESGMAVPRPVYHVERDQSECPHTTLFPHLAAYRAGSSRATHVTTALTWTRDDKKTTSRHRGTLVAGAPVTVVRFVTGEPWKGSDVWAELDTGAYVWAGQLKEVGP